MRVLSERNILLYSKMLKKYLLYYTLYSLLVAFPAMNPLHAKAEDTCGRCREPVVIYSVYADYDDVWRSLEAALNGQGLTVSSVSHVGEMLDRTGKELGRTKRIFEKANVMEFCSAVLSRNMLEKNPHYITFCPYQIMVYTLPDDKKKVYLSYRHLIWRDDSGRDVLEPVEDLLDNLVKEVIEMYK